jgi:cell volume regulation protein A
MQITMFMTLGLLVFPKQLVPIAAQGLLISLVLIVLARPLGVFFGLLFTKLGIRARALISWVGLRGSVPIVLATFPLMAGLDQDHYIFNLVFFIVITSVALQGTTIPFVARLLRVNAPLVRQRRYPIEFDSSEKTTMELVDFIVPYGSKVAGQPIVKLGFPKDSLITLVVRDEQFLMPSGDTVLEEGDVLLVLVDCASVPAVRAVLEQR